MSDEFNLEFDFNVLCSSKRQIEGIASMPTLDRQKEIILKGAIANALSGYMELPVLHVDHTERPIGIVTKAEVRPEGLYVRAVIKQKDTDDVWEKIEKGEYRKFSVFGRRTQYSPECRLPHTIRSDENPCVTSRMRLDSISVVSNSAAVNPDSWLTVMKAIVEDSEKYISTERLNETVVGTKMVDEIDEPIVESSALEEPEIVQKADDSMVEFRGLLTDIKDLLVAQAAPKAEVVQKADLETPDIETIVKARVESEVETIKKAFDDKITELTTRIDKMENETIKKGGNIVVIPSEFDANASFGNATALREFDEVK